MYIDKILSVEYNEEKLGKRGLNLWKSVKFQKL